MTASPEALRAGGVHLLTHCGCASAGESILLLGDDRTEACVRHLEECARLMGLAADVVIVPPLEIHGAEPSLEVAERMKRADVIFGITTMSLAHTQARLAASNAGARYLSLPDYSLDVLGGMALTADFRSLTATADAFARRVSEADVLHLRSTGGTDLECVTRGRSANSAPGWVRRAGDLASPPDAEVNVPPVEGTAYGVIVVDGSIPAPGLGLLSEPITLEIGDGRINRITGANASVLQRLFKTAGTERAWMLGEVGWGLNPLAQLRGSMLEDEGCVGTVHFGFGSNIVLGGKNQVAFHVDCIVREVTTRLDGKKVEIRKHGE